MSKYVRIKSKESKGSTKNCVKVGDQTFTFEKYPVGTRPEFEKVFGLLQPVVDCLNADHEEIESGVHTAIKRIQDGDRVITHLEMSIAALEEDIKEKSQEYNRVSAAAKDALECNRLLLQEKAKMEKNTRELAEELRLERCLSDEFKKVALDYKAQCDSARAREAGKAEDWNAVKEQAAAARAGATAKAEAKEKSSSVFTQATMIEALKKAERSLYPPFGYDFRVQQPKSSIFRFDVPECKKDEEPLTSEMVERIIFGENPRKPTDIPKDQKRGFIQEATDMGWKASDYLGSAMFSGTKGADKYQFKKSFVDGKYRMWKNEQVMVVVPEAEEYEYYLPILSDLIVSGNSLKDVVLVKA